MKQSIIIQYSIDIQTVNLKMRLTVNQRVELIQLRYGNQRISAEDVLETYIQKHPAFDFPSRTAVQNLINKFENFGEYSTINSLK